MADVFRFQQFDIHQDRCAMKVGTDGVLLGAWGRGGKHVLDIGTGTGLIALMMAQRFPDAQIDGIDIDADAASQAKENVEASKFRDKVNIFNVRLQNFEPSEPYDAIVTNPPFFANGLKSPDRKRSLARSASNLSFDDIFGFAKRWLSEDGIISAIVPIDVVEDFSESAFMNGFFLSARCDVKTVPRKNVRRCLIAFSLERSKTFIHQTVTMKDAEGNDTEWYRQLTGDFYLAHKL